MEFGAEELERMKQIENVVAKSIATFRNGRTEAGLIVFALVRVARVVLRMYPPKTQADLIPVLVRFLEDRGDNADAGEGLIIQ